MAHCGQGRVCDTAWPSQVVDQLANWSPAQIIRTLLRTLGPGILFTTRHLHFLQGPSDENNEPPSVRLPSSRIANVILTPST